MGLEHAARDLGTSGPWKGLLAFSNIGLAGKAVHGRGWPKHRERLIRLVTELFKASSVHGGGPELLGIFLNEVGNLSDLFDDTAKGKFEDMMREAFARATMDVPQVLWSPGETMAALRPDVPVECLSRLSHLPRVNSWREVERFTIHGATEHGTCKLLVYNNHQPASDDRPFPANMRIAFCKAIIIDREPDERASNRAGHVRRPGLCLRAQIHHALSWRTNALENSGQDAHAWR